MALLETLYALCPANISLVSIFKCKETLVSNSNGFTGDLVCTLPCKHSSHYSILNVRKH
jgi:hypothetical protein